MPQNTNSEIIQNSLNTVQAAPRFHSEKAPPAAQACSLDLFLREISRAPFRGNKWLSSLELAARRAKLIGKTHVRTPQVRRLLPKRELVRKGSEKNCEECVSSETCSTHPKARENFAHCAASGQRTRTRRPRSESPRGDQPQNPPQAQTENPLPCRRCERGAARRRYAPTSRQLRSLQTGTPDPENPSRT